MLWIIIMDLFIYYAKHQVLVYELCAYAVAPLHLVSYIRSLHAHKAYHNAGLDFTKFRVYKAAKIIADCLKEKYSLLNPRAYVILQLLPTDPPLPDLKLYRSY
jgi:hypothetical protein